MAIIDKVKNKRVTPNVTYDVGADANNVTYDSTETYQDGSVGKELSTLKEDLSDWGISVVDGAINVTFTV